jgi:hypothetical protein
MKVLAIDPGNVLSAFCLIDADTLKPLLFNKVSNDELHKSLKEWQFGEDDCVVIEMVESFGMGVGKTVFETVFWIGRFFETASRRVPKNVFRIYRKEEKLHICHSVKAKDSNISTALIDRFAKHSASGKGTKDKPDFFYGFSKDVWAAYAVGLTFIETKLNLEG